MTLAFLYVIFAGIFGLLVGSFSNVLIWRLPRGESIAFPPSHCPKCDHKLGFLDLFPVFSWLFLGGKCRYCKEPINARYPIVELISGLGYALIMYLFPFESYGLAAIGLMLLFTILLVGSVIDLDTYTLPDELTIPSIVLGIGFALLNQQLGFSFSDLPNLQQAIYGALFGAGLLSAVDIFGSLILRRFKERQYPDFPIGYQQITLGMLVGAWFGPLYALIAALIWMVVNVVAKKVIPTPELVLILGFVVSIVIKSSSPPELLAFISQALTGAGVVAIFCGVFWWIHRLIYKPDPQEEENAPYDPIAMGFGDVKLMAGIGAFLGWQAVLFTLGVATAAGALFGVVQMLRKQENRVKFGPFLALGAIVYLVYGRQVIEWYLSMLGIA